MQTKRKRTVTTSETATILILRRTAANARAGWCVQCESDVMWIAHTALDLFGITTLPANGVIHTNASGICSRSLLKEIGNGEKQ